MSVDEIKKLHKFAGTKKQEHRLCFVKEGIASLPNKPKYLAADALDTRLPLTLVKRF